MSLLLSHALRASNFASIAFTGAGGKTTAMFQLAKELSKDSPVIVSASSHLGVWQTSPADQHLVVKSPEEINELAQKLRGVILLTGTLDGDRTKPLDDHILNRLNEFCKDHSVPLLIEADGSRGKPLKAWADHEPPIPAFVEQVIHIAGLTGIGKPLNGETVHRPEIFSALSGLKIGDIITPEAVTRVLIHRTGGQKNIPAGASKVLLLNQADTPELQSIAHGMTQGLLAGFHSVVVASLIENKVHAVHEPVAGIVLAAGESTRYGASKQLLDWKGQPFIRAVARTALEAGLAQVIVVTGANAEKVEATIADLKVQLVRNDEWKSGQGSSVRKGILSINHPPPSLRDTSPKFFEFGGGWKGVGAAIFLLVDQPQITPSILRALVEKHSEGLYPIVAPLVIDQRANPVLFDRVTFSDLLQLEGDMGGRGIFHKYRVEYLPWHDDRLLLDVDTPEQYQRLVSDDTL